jgi:hypothetical protein
MTETTTTDPIASARANLRDTIKWLITALAALAATVLGSSPLTAFGTLTPGWRLYLAIGCGFTGLMLVLAAIYIAFRLLVWKPFFLSEIASDSELSTFIQANASDLLPAEFPKLDEFLKARKEARETLQNTALQPNDPLRAKAERFIRLSDPFVERLISFAYFERLRSNLIAKSRVLFALIICAVIALGAFAWAANPIGKTSEVEHSASSRH